MNMDTLDIHKVRDTDTLLGISLLNALLIKGLISQKEYNVGVKEFILQMEKPNNEEKS